MIDQGSRLGRALKRVAIFAIVLGILAASIWWLFQYFGVTLIRVDRTETELKRSPSVFDDQPPAPAPAEFPRNVILFIADGMGFAHLALTRAVHHEIDGPTVWDRFPVTGWHRASPSDGYLTDSAASATALATGEVTYNGAIGVDANGEPRQTLIERAQELGYRTGLITDSYVWDATPASFAAHTDSRRNGEDILRQYGESSLDLLFGGLKDVEPATWEAAVELLGQRFEVVGPDPLTRDELVAAAPGKPLAVLFEDDQVRDLDSAPTLPTLAGAALDRLGEGPFVLMIECEETDTASHGHNLERVLRGILAIEATLELLLDYAAVRGDTLVVFTSDHETAGLAVSVTDRSNQQLRALWPSLHHTGAPVPVMASGPGSELFAGSRANWQLGRLFFELLNVEPEDSVDPLVDVGRGPDQD
ncbi:MAG: alkaline phosphatase [Acidobacteriota bacterium]